MNYYDEIKNKLVDNEIYSKVKDYSKERYRVMTYFEIGRLLSEAGSKYGDNILLLTPYATLHNSSGYRKTIPIHLQTLWPA